MSAQPEDVADEREAGVTPLLALARREADRKALDLESALASLLRPIVARVLRTGCGPAAVVEWVMAQPGSGPPSGEGPGRCPQARELSRRLARVIVASGRRGAGEGGAAGDTVAGL